MHIYLVLEYYRAVGISELYRWGLLFWKSPPPVHPLWGFGSLEIIVGGCHLGGPPIRLLSKRRYLTSIQTTIIFCVAITCGRFPKAANNFSRGTKVHIIKDALCTVCSIILTTVNHVTGKPWGSLSGVKDSRYVTCHTNSWANLPCLGKSKN